MNAFFSQKALSPLRNGFNKIAQRAAIVIPVALTVAGCAVGGTYCGSCNDDQADNVKSYVSGRGSLGECLAAQTNILYWLSHSGPNSTIMSSYIEASNQTDGRGCAASPNFDADFAASRGQLSPVDVAVSRASLPGGGPDAAMSAACSIAWNRFRGYEMSAKCG
jgi:hypothetical protein